MHCGASTAVPVSCKPPPLAPACVTPPQVRLARWLTLQANSAVGKTVTEVVSSASYQGVEKHTLLRGMLAR